MRIAMISNLYPPEARGGYEILCAQIAERLAMRGHRVEVLTTGTAVPGEASESNLVRVHRILELYLPFNLPGRLARHRRWRTSRINRRAAAAFIESNPVDLVFCFSQLRLTLGAVRAAQAAHLPLFWSFNDLSIASYLAAPSLPNARGLAAAAIDRYLFPDLTLRGLDLSRSLAISGQLRADLLTVGVAAERTEIVHQGIPIENFPFKADAGSLGARPRILYVGQLHPDKGVHTLITAIDLLSSDPEVGSVELSVVGDGLSGYRRLLEIQARSSKADIKFLGRKPHETLPQTYRDHDIFVFPSEWREPFGLTHLEAMASGLPVVSTDHGGHGELIEDGVNALAFPAGNPEALAQALKRLLHNPNLRRELTSNARRLVEERFSLEAYVDALEAFLARTHEELAA